MVDSKIGKDLKKFLKKHAIGETLALADAKRYLIGFRARYQYLTELDGVIAAIDLLELKEEYHLGTKLLEEGEE